MQRQEIDELRHAQQALTASEARLQLVLKGSDDGWWDWDLQTDALFYSPRWWAMLGYASDELTADGDLWRRLMHPDDLAHLEQPFRIAMARGPDRYEVECRLRHKAGHYVPVLSRGHILRAADGRALRIAGTTTDLTARKAVEAARRETESNHQELLEAMVDGVFVAQDHRFVFANPALPAMLGYAQAEFVGLPFERVIDPDYLPMWMQRFDARIAGGAEPPRHYEVRLLVKGGAGMHCVELRASRTEFQGRPAVLGIVRDVSERKQAEAARLQLEDRLRETQKMEAIGTLAGGVAHDFNNVLAAILVNVVLAGEDLSHGHPAHLSLEQIHKAALRARSLVQQILAFSRRQPQQLQNQPLAPVVDETLQLLRATLPAVVTLEARLPAQPLHVLADATQVQQALMNLCTNAWHALSGSSGRIVVAIEAVNFGAGAPPPEGMQDGPAVRLSVSDNGCGMDEAALARVFEPFYTTKPVGQGTGLGLAVVHGIAAGHGGAITVTSRLGEGSRFELYFPLVEPGTEPMPLDPLAPARPPPGGGQGVLYIDDDEVMLLTVERLLKRAGYRVACYAEPRAALAAVHAAPEAFDLVVSDFNMPGFSGLDVARDLARVRPDLPVVISSGYISEELRDEARRLGVHELLHKERTVEELGLLVHRLLGPAA